MTNIKPQILSDNLFKILSILKGIVKNESNHLILKYPVLIGSHAAKWYIPSFREPNDWDLVATVSQSILFIHNLTSIAAFKYIKLIHYSGVGLKIIGKCIELNVDENVINFEIELASNDVNLKEMKLNKIIETGYDDNIRKLQDAQSRIGKLKIDTVERVNISEVTYIREEVGNLNHKLVEASIINDNVDQVNEFEFENFNHDQERDQLKMSAQMILELCHDVKDIKLFPLSSFPCIVAPLKILEALKASHIYWSTDFHKNIADLHSIRVILGYNKVPITQPLCNPIRDEQIELMLNTRIKETEMIRGVPAAHINLNKTNQEFLDREDDLFVQRYISHDELHERVKYGDRPIHETLKNDKSKAWIKKSLFEQIDYQTQLNCVREEAMAIALERYLIPMISENQDTSYRSALVKICTSLTKGWFRQFAINNYPRLSNLDKDLLPIARKIINDHPLPQKKREVPSTLLDKWILDPETLAIFKPIYPCTEIISSFKKINYKPSRNIDFVSNRTGIKITSPVNDDISFTAVITTMCLTNFEDCNPGANWSASVVITSSEYLEDTSDNDHCFDPLEIHPFNDEYYEDVMSKLTSGHIFVLDIRARTNGSWGVGQDIWEPPIVFAKSADHIASKLEFPGFTGDLLFKYVLAYLQPTIPNNGSTPLKHDVDELKSEGIIPVKPQQHLWYDAWNYTLKSRKGKWSNYD